MSDQESVWNALKQMARLKARATAAEAENAKLKKLLAESLLENEVTREALRKKW